MVDINLYGAIGADEESVSAAGFAAMMADVSPDETLTVYINSPGGSVFDGLTIYQSLAARSGENRIVIQGVAASIASVIAMAGDTIIMGQSSRMMIHNPMGPSSIAFGTAADLRDAAADTLATAQLLDSVTDTLADVYMSRTGQTRETIGNWMTDETWFTAADAKQHRFADKITPNKSLAARHYPDVVAVAVADQVELEELASLAANIMPRDTAARAAQRSASDSLRLRKAKQILTNAGD